MNHDLDLQKKTSKGTLATIVGRFGKRSERIANQMEVLWNHLYNDVRSLVVREDERHVHPRVDVLESQNIYDIRVDLPGIDANSIDLQTQGRILLVKAKRTCVEAPDLKMSHCEHTTDVYERGIRLAEDAVVEQKSATFSDGILSIRVPRKAA